MSCEKKSCPQVPEPPEDKPFLYVVEMLKQIKADLPCYTDHSYTEVEKSAFGINVYSDVRDVSNVTLNCEEIQAIAKSYKKTQTDISCIISNTCNKQSATMSAIQNMNIECKNLKVDTISQRADTSLIISLDLTDNDDMISQIKNKVQDFTNEMAEVIKTSTKGTMKDEKGARTASQIQEKINNLNYSSAIRDTIIEFNTNMKLGQTLNLEGESVCIFNNITQNIQAKMIAVSILNRVLDSAFGNVLKTIATEDKKEVEKRKRLDKNNDDDKSKSNYIIYGVIAGVVLLLLIIIILVV